MFYKRYSSFNVSDDVTKSVEQLPRMVFKGSKSQIFQRETISDLVVFVTYSKVTASFRWLLYWLITLDDFFWMASPF